MSTWFDIVKRPVLVTGGTGQIGRSLLWGQTDAFDFVAPSRAELDLSDPAALEAAVNAREWAAVVNCAAYTAVDKAESDVTAAWQVNALAPAALAAATARAGIPIIHLSTDYVFDGEKPEPYQPDDPVRPLGVYGASKEGGEQAVRTANPDHVILRTAWVVSRFGNNFVKTMLRLGRERSSLRVVADQHGCPTSAHDIGRAIIRVLECTMQTRAYDQRTCVPMNRPAFGTFHFVNMGEASWHDLASHVLARAGITIPVEAIATADYPTPARRPLNSRLDCESFGRAFGHTNRRWDEAIDEMVDALVRETA